ncbi:MAG: type II secretion system protein [Phycisphaerae bacterium]
MPSRTHAGRNQLALPVVSSARSGAFTLIELLAVVAIIALLVSILIPSFRTAREMARRAPCQANLKSMGAGFLGYAGANKQWYPPYTVSFDPGPYAWVDWSTNPATVRAYHKWSTSSWSWWWCDFMAQYFDADAKPTTLAIHQTYGNTSACIGLQPGDGVYNRLGYNDSTSWTNGRIVVSRKMKCAAQKPASTASYDNKMNYDWYMACTWSGRGIQWWHYDKSGEVFADGSSSWPQFMGDVPDWQAYNTPSPAEAANVERMVQIVEPANYAWGTVSMSTWPGGVTGYSYIDKMPHEGYTNAVFMDGHVETFSKFYVKTYLDDALRRAARYNQLHPPSRPEWAAFQILGYPFAVPPDNYAETN